MTVKVFLTGSTGYIGGTANDYIQNAHPDWEYTLLVRNEQRGKPVQEKYPKAKLVYGDLSDSDKIAKAAAEADIVIHTADSSDDVASAEAIAKGLKEGHTAEKPGYWIHVSGTAILCWYDARNERYGEAPLPEQAYNDVTSIEKLRNLPDDAFHRNVDKIVQASNTDAVRTAIVCPPTIYGSGRGAVNTRSMQVPNLAKAALEKGFVPIVGAGKTEWDHVHVDDLGEMMSQLAGASQDSSKRDDREIFGPNGYFFVENGTHKWGEVAKWVAAEASRQGYLPEALTKTVSRTEVDNTSLAGAPTWSINSKGKAQRAKERLGWKATGVSLRDTIGEIVKVEAKALGLTPKE